MRDCSNGEVLFRLVCLVLLSSVESFHWTALQTNPTLAIKGQDVSLTWNYSLTADELLKMQGYFTIAWKRLTQSSSVYDIIGTKFYIPGAVNVGEIGYNEPRKPHIEVDRNDPATLHIKDVKREDEGTYMIEFTLVSFGNIIGNHEVNLTVLELSEIGNVSNNQDVCEGSMVTLHCNATGKPKPNITWTRVWENGTDSEPLQVVDGNYVMSNIQRSSNGTYRCTAYNGVGDSVNRTVEVLVRYSASVVRVVSSSNTVTEGDTYNLSCEVSGDPIPINVTWTKWSNNQRSDGNILKFTNIKRNDSGDYRCEAENKCGKGIKNESINVFYDPDMVTLVTNTTENKDCSDLWVNFTCISSEANPPVYNYLLFEDGKGFSSSKSGTWIKKISRGTKVSYNCTAYQLVGNVTSTNNVTLTVNGPPSVEQAKNITVEEGDNVEVYCNASGIPDPTVSWENMTEGNLLNISNISRAQAGEYRCIANNTCGETSTVMHIDVQYQPENVRLSTNVTSKVCAGIAINFTCTAEANPPVHTYLVYKNDTEFKKMGRLGTATKTVDTSTGGQFVFRCEAKNSVQGTGRSSDTILTVDVPASVEQAEKKIVKEHENVKVYCNANGTPKPTVTWKNVTDDLSEGNLLNIINITRAQAGEYRCTANNTCGEAFTVVDIDVQYPPSISPEGHTIDATEGSSTSIPCPVTVGNPPPTITWYKGNDTRTKIVAKSTLVFLETKLSDSGWYTCSAKNNVGTVTTSIYLLVESTEVHATATIDVTCDKRLEVETEFPRMACKLNEDQGCVSAKAKDSRCGSVIIDFVMKFNQGVDGNKVLTVLKDAAQQKKFGDYKVNSITLSAPSSTVTPGTTSTTSTQEPDQSSFFTDKDGNIKVEIVVIVAVVGVVIICAIIGIVAWWVHKKRKCRKNHKVHHEEQPLSTQDGARADDNPYAHANNGYAEAGPVSTEMSEMEQSQEASGPAIVPAYAVVDKSAKKGKKDKKKDKQAAEQKPPEDQYAVVDKSKKKKKKKEEPDATYAQVDMSKKSKKKANPGEGVYADLGDFNQMREMPKVSTSPQPLPPIKKPTPYGETEYADITQFLKGDAKLPDSNNSQGQATETDSNSQGQATVANSNSSQGPATDTKNTDKDGAAKDETFF